MLPRVALPALLALCCARVEAAPGRGPFTVRGAQVFDADNHPVVFRGIGLSCTEYMARPGFPDPAPPPSDSRHPFPPAALESYPGSFAWSCFGGRPAANASLQLNDEPAK